MSIIILEHSSTTGAGRLGAALRDYGHRLRFVALHEGDRPPADLDDVDGVITTGGPQSAADDHEWLEAEKSFLQSADALSLPVIGLCLGCQILTDALGGEVGEVDGGIELGWHDVTLTPVGTEDVLYAGIAWTSAQPHWHRQQVSAPPPGARVLASSQRCPVQAWGRGLRTYAFQYHPEIELDTLEGWAAAEPKALDEAGITPDDLRDATARNYPAFSRLSDRLFESIALFLLRADQRGAGPARDLHH